MTTTIFTPIHKPELDKLWELYESLRAQIWKVDEWVILCNGGAKDWIIDFIDRDKDPWIKVYHTDTTGNIGALKGECCDLALGDILIEVDYDDHLTPDAVELIYMAFRDNMVQFVYSNSVEYLPDGSSQVYGAQYGWQTKPHGDQTQMIAFPPKAQYFRRIEWAPNHVRAFRRSAYEAIGGYDKNIQVGDDHELVCRFYVGFGEHGFRHINECLYLYRVHDGNTCNGRNRNAEIQKQVDANYCRYAEKMYLRWADDNGLDCYDLGGRFNSPPGYQSVDLLDADVIADLTKAWPMSDNSVGVLRAYHILEHLPDSIHFFNEAYRVLAPGGFLLIEVPSSNGEGAWSDPTHINFMNKLSFEYFTNRDFAKFIQPQYTGRFQKARVVEYWWKHPEIPIISAQLIAIKGWYNERWAGEKQI